MSYANKAYALNSGEGKAIWFFGSLVTMKAVSSDTNNAFALQEQVCPPGLQAPLHVHHHQDEAFYILEGEVTVICGEQVWRATAGSFAFLPKGVAHTFKVEGSTPARMLVITSPGGPSGFEYFVEEMGEHAPTFTIPTAGPPDEQRLLTLAEKYSIEVLFPSYHDC
jgi:mannose-6-phosphate isomerase-like protein (cupin superfamily)